MYITICDVPSKFTDELKAMGGKIMRSYNGLIDVQFTSDKFKMKLFDGDVEIRSRETYSIYVLNANEFSAIYIN